MASIDHGSTPATATRTAAGLLAAAVIAAFTWLFLANSWTGDDAFISYRVASNFLDGRGLTYNPVERVQAFTNPLWTLTISLLHGITGEAFFTTHVLSWACVVALLWLMARRLPSPIHFLVAGVWLFTSKAFIDYTSSGLEYPLAYLLVGALTLRTMGTPAVTLDPWQALRTDVLLGSLAYLTRPDMALIAAGPVLWRAWHVPRWRDRRLAGALLLGASPAALWSLFAVVYYGFPFPNTYYAKVATGLPQRLVWGQGLAYLANSLAYDPVTLLTVAIACCAAVTRRHRAAMAACGSALLYAAYTVHVGGDFMSGRFFTVPFLVSVIVLVSLLPATAHLGVIATLVLWNVVNPLAPMKTDADYAMAWPWRQQNGIKDERGGYHRATNLLRYDPLRALPDFPWVWEGHSVSRPGTRVIEHGSIGLVGYYGGPELYVIDRNALSDPLLARLPVSDRIHFEYYAGHFFRDLPAGYRESRESGENRIQDPLVHELFDALRTVTAGPLFSTARLRAIWDLNVGRLSNVHERVRAGRPVSLSVRAGHWRFATDVGDRDGEGRWLKTTGRRGYLQLGPGIPLRSGRFTARWLLTIPTPGPTALGTVEAWADGRLIAAAPVGPADGREVTRELRFLLPRPAYRVDYRFFVNAGVDLTLERIDLESN